MKKKIIIIGLAVLLIAISCGKKEAKNADKNNPEKTAAETSKDSGNISENEIKKYTEYISLKNVPNEEEWQDSFKEVFTREFSDEKGEFKKPSAKGIESIIKTEDTVNIFSEYVKDLEENIKKEPKFDEVDKSAEGLVQSLNNEKNVITEIVDYYKNKKYEKFRRRFLHRIKKKQQGCNNNRYYCRAKYHQCFCLCFHGISKQHRKYLCNQ